MNRNVSLLPGGGGACVDDLGARDRRAGGRAEEHKAARRRKEAAAIAAENRRTYQRIASAKPHYSNADAAKHAARHAAVLRMHHEARGNLPDMTSDLTKQQPNKDGFASFGMGAYTLHDKKHGFARVVDGGGVGGVGVGVGVGGPVPAPWHRTVGWDVKERYVEYVATAPAEVPPWLDGTGISGDDDGMAARLFKKNFLDNDARAWKD